MSMLSLNEPPELPARNLSRAEAIGASILVHLLLLLLFVRGVDGLPEPLARWIRAHAARPREAVAAVPVPEPGASPKQKEKEKEKEKPIPPVPLKFAYVKVPEEAQQKKNPDAALLSDRDRRARQEVPTPPDARRFTRDPHSEGDSRDRVRPDPRLKEGKDMPEPPSPQTDSIASKDVEGKAEETPDDGKAGASGENGESPERPPDQTAQNGSDGRPPDPNGRASQAPLPGQGGRPAAGDAGHNGGPGASRRPDLREGSEFKFRFENPGWLKGGAFDGTLSFDTKGYPWGDYARKIYVIIRNNWFDRIPLAAREGIQGYTCQHFVIGKDGTISDLDVKKTSPVPPFNKAASDALRASSALPPLPSDFDHDSEGVTFCFFYNMYPEEAD